MMDMTFLFGGTSNKYNIYDFRAFPSNGPTRWLLESRYRKPWHLNTWPRSSLKSRTVFRGVWALSTFGILPPSSTISISCNEASPYAMFQRDFDKLGVFLGTPGSNRKIVVFAENKEQSVFIKIPTSQASSELVENEARALAELALFDDVVQFIPTAQRIEGYLAIENLQKNGVQYGVLPLSSIRNVHNILFQRSAVMRSFNWFIRTFDISYFSDFTGNLNHNQRTEKQVVISDNKLALQKFLEEFDCESPILSYMAHGDFTRWNVLLSPQGSPRIIDWEFYGLKPKYFDLIHYYVSSDILVSRRAASKIINQLNQIGKVVCAEDAICTKDWNQYLCLYFAYQSLYYVPIFKSQENLHPQAIWQIKTWTECLYLLSSHIL